jgi:hypothetical protein
MHWVALQGFAWVNMAIAYSQKSGLATGLDQTFDGNHPCPMCKAIAKITTKEKQKSASLALSPVKIQVFLAQRTVWIFSSRHVEGIVVSGPFTGPERNEAPPVPPPRSSLV